MGHLTDEQRARLALRVTERCIRLADGDVDAALSAAEQIADEADDKELSRLYRREFGTTPQPRTEDRGKSRLSCPLSAAERGADRARQRATLRTLDLALSAVAEQHAGIRLALADVYDDGPWAAYYRQQEQ